MIHRSSIPARELLRKRLMLSGKFVILFLGSVSASLSCTGPAPMASATAPQPPQAGQLGWLSLSEKTTCEAMQSASCLGFYGFAVDATGNFTIGPNQSGNTSKGVLKQSELNTLSQDVIALLATNPTASLNSQCQALPGPPGVSDEVDLVTSSQQTFQVYVANGTTGSVCYEGGQLQAQTLHRDMNALMREYYPVPF